MTCLRRHSLIPVFALAAAVLFGGASRAVTFNFKIPSIPWPPVITDVSNTVASLSGGSFIVTATIAAQLQQTPTCDKPNIADCTSADWYLKPSPGVTPNPPAIKMAKVYYRLNDGAAAYVDMTAAPELGDNKWRATITIDPAAANGDIYTYYIVAVDSRGNVVSQTPDTGSQTSTCPPSPSSWFDNLSTPKTDSCTHATSYTQCNLHQNGSPTCGSSFTMNDKNSDVCGEPDGNGNQSLVNVPKLDITGITVAADKDYLCANMGLGAAPPDSNDVSPIEGYLLIIFNPDKPDDNPADFQIKNAYAITYAPEVQATDPTLVRVLWDANCVTDPNTANILDCKLIYVTGTDKKLQVGYNSGLKFIVKKSGTGNPLAVPYSLIGDTRKMNYIVGLTGEINLSGANPFWISDLTAGLTFYHKNQTATVCAECINLIAPPVVTSATPAADGCSFSFQKSISASVTSYNIYRETAPSFTGNTLAGTVSSSGAASYTFPDKMQGSLLNGNTYYYFAKSVMNGKESDPSDYKSCTVADTYPPAAPTISKAATPSGGDGVCKIEFSIPASDSSLKDFVVYRDGAPANQSDPVTYSNGVLQYSFTDVQLPYNSQHTYKVKAADKAGNTTESVTYNCSPEDLKAPAAPVFISVNLPGKLGVHFDFTKPADSDLAGYRVYGCLITNPNTDCKSAGAFTLISGSSPLPVDPSSFEYSATSFFTVEGQYAFYVESLDNCDTAGTCPSRGASNPNASGFPQSPIVIDITVNIPANRPAFPSSLSATAPPEGKKCKITWAKNYKNSDGTAFSDPVNPSPSDLVGYKIMRGTQGAVPAPNEANPVGVVTLSSLEFTDTTVLNNVPYSYTVYAVNAFGNFSEPGAGGAKTETLCTPDITIPPAAPVMLAPIDYSSISCSPAWAAVPDASSYKVYKCGGAKGSAACAAANKFTPDENCAPGQSTTCTNNTSLITDSTYTFCVTAVGETGKESAVYPAGQLNCGECTPSARPKPVTSVNATSQNNKDTKIYWTNSDSLAQNNTSASGVNIYRCTDQTCASKTVVKTCADLKADSSTVQNIGPASPLSLASEPPGTWYYSVTFQTECGTPETESFHTGGTAIGGPVTISAECPAADCIVLYACSDLDVADAAKNLDCGLREVVVSSYNSVTDQAGSPVVINKDPARSSYKSGVKIYLVKEDGTVAADPATTDSNGNYRFNIDSTSNPLDLTKKYLLVMRIPASDKSGIACTKPGDLGQTVSPLFGNDCGIIFAKNITLKKGESNAVKAKFSIYIPAKGQGRSEIGNFDCDKSVGLADFAIFKANMKLAKVSSGAAKYADINQDGFVNLTDFNLFKQNFGKQLDAAPSFVPDLCKQ